MEITKEINTKAEFKIALDPYFNFLEVGILVVSLDLEVWYYNGWMKSNFPSKDLVNLNELFTDHSTERLHKIMTGVVKNQAPRFLSSILHKWLIPLYDQRFSDDLMRQSCSVAPFHYTQNGERLVIIQIRDDSERVLQVKKLNSEKKHVEFINTQLQQEINAKNAALAELNVLHGMIPICSNCKSIRDDEGSWNQLETYISNHSEAQFSHGICPVCEEKLYGNQDWYREMKAEMKTNKKD